MYIHDLGNKSWMEPWVFDNINWKLCYLMSWFVLYISMGYKYIDFMGIYVVNIIGIIMWLFSTMVYVVYFGTDFG